MQKSGVKREITHVCRYIDAKKFDKKSPKSLRRAGYARLKFFLQIKISMQMRIGGNQCDSGRITE